MLDVSDAETIKTLTTALEESRMEVAALRELIEEYLTGTMYTLEFRALYYGS